ncbi:hypothetical protein M8494_21135 [Serratia ureilytica]
MHHDQKGRGYAPARSDPISFHAVPKFDPASARCRKAPAVCRPIRKSSATGCVKTAAKDSSLMAITPAMREAPAWGAVLS